MRVGGQATKIFFPAATTSWTYRFPSFFPLKLPARAGKKKKVARGGLWRKDDACIVVIYLRSDGVGYRFFARSKVGARAAGKVEMRA